MFKAIADAVRYSGWRTRLVRAVRPTKVYYRPLGLGDAVMKDSRRLMGK